MTALMIYLLKSGLWLAVFFTIYWFFLRKETFFRFNRFYLLSGLILSLTLPAYQFKYPVKVILPVNIEVSTEMIPHQEVIAPSFDWMNVVYIVYLLGVCFFLFMSIIGLKKLRAFIKKNTVVSGTKYKIVESPLFKTPFSAFNYIFLHSGFVSDTNKQLILEHEQAHIEQYHWVDLVLIKLICIVQWYNPIIWRYANCIVQNHEYLADKEVLQKGNSPSAYQSVILSYSLNARAYPFTNSFAYSTNNLKRFNMMKTQLSNPIRKWAVLLILPVAGLIFWAFAEPEYIVSSSAFTEKETLAETPMNMDNHVGGDSILIMSGAVVYDNHHIQSNDSGLVVVGYGSMDDVRITESGLSTHSPKSDNGSEGLVMKTDTAVKYTTCDSKPIHLLENKPLFILDGEEISYAVFEALDPRKIESVDVLKDKSAIDAYGDKGKYGAVVVSTKKTTESPPFSPSFRTNSNTPPLFIVDGKEVSNLDKIKPEEIESISVLKDKPATDTYGDKGKNGVVIVTLKKEK